MSFLPVLTREMQCAARRGGTYWFRLGTAGLAMAIGGFSLFLGVAGAPPGVGGQSLFHGLSSLLVVVCLLEGARSTADSISAEKREGTLGLLFLTDLRGYDVVLGKLASTSVSVFYALMGVGPVLALAIPLGGVTLGETWRMTLVLFNLLFLSLAAGLATSAGSRDGRRTFAVSLATSGAVCLLPLAAGGIVGLWGSPTAAPLLRTLSPLSGYWATADTVFSRAPGKYWTALIAGQAASWILLIYAGWATARAWRADPSRLPERHERRRRLSDRDRRRCLDAGPASWLFRQRDTGRWMLGVMLALLAASAAAMLMSGGGDHNLVAVIFLAAWLLLWWVKIAVTVQAAHSMAEIRRNGFLETLLVTPLNHREIIGGHVRAALRTWAPPATALLGGQVLIAVGIGVLMRRMGGAQASFSLGMLLLPLELGAQALDLVALFWVASWLGLSSGKGNSAAVKTLLLVQILPSFVCCGLRLFTNAAFWAWARTQLYQDFRTVAQRPLARSSI